MNRKITFLLIAILALNITANAEVLNLTQKDTFLDNGTWIEKEGGATATLTYNTAGQTFDFILNGTVNQSNEKYTLIYYADIVPTGSVTPGMIGYIISSNITSDEFGKIYKEDSIIMDSIPYIEDANSLPTSNGNNPGAKIWLVPSVSIINNASLDWSKAREFLYEENLEGSVKGVPSHLIKYTQDITSPIITVDPVEINIEVESPEYVDVGVTATDGLDGIVPVTTTGTVDTSIVGTYVLTYTATDSSGNVAIPITRTIFVVPHQIVLCQKVVNTDPLASWGVCNENEPQAVFSYSPNPENRNNMDFTIDADVPTDEDYTLIYYKDTDVNHKLASTKPVNKLTESIPSVGGTIDASGIWTGGDIPASDDVNPRGKIWLVPTSEINEDGSLKWTGYSNGADIGYLFESDLYDETTDPAEISTVLTRMGGITFKVPAIVPTPIPTSPPTTSSSSSSSSGSGGMGVSSNEQFNNIAQSDRKALDWRAGYQTKYEFKQNVYEVIINAISNEDEVMVKYEGLKDRSSSVTSNPPGTDHKYFNLYSGSKRFKSATIRFKSEKTPVILYRWTNGNWEAQSVFEIGREGNNILYESEVSGFSNFAISSIDIPAPTIEVAVTPQITITLPKTTETPTATPVPTITPSIPGFNGILFLIAGLVAFGIFKLRKN